MPFHTTRLATVVLALALLAAACGGSAEGDGSTPASTSSPTAAGGATTTEPARSGQTTLPTVPPSDYAGFAAQETACGATAPKPVQTMTFDAPEDQHLDPNRKIRASIVTSCGDIVVELDPSIAPETVNSFVFLARHGFFDGSVSHRVVPGFVVQAGDPTATGRGGPGYVISDELPAPGFVYTKGSLAMANSGPNTGGSQFFITLADVSLPNDYSYFGEVVDGFDTLDVIARIPLGVNPFGEQSVPLETLYIEHITIDG